MPVDRVLPVRRRLPEVLQVHGGPPGQERGLHVPVSARLRVLERVQAMRAIVQDPVMHQRLGDENMAADDGAHRNRRTGPPMSGHELD